MFFLHDFNSDIDNDGENDAFIKELDPDGDGVSHVSLIDTKGCFYNGFGIDLDGDGTLDITYTTDTGLSVNLDDDGANEFIFSDSDGDGKADSFILDVNGDGNPELELYDSNGDGHFDTKHFDLWNAIDAISDLISGDYEEPSFVNVPDDTADPFDPDSYDEPDDVISSDEPAYNPSNVAYYNMADLDGDGYEESLTMDTDGDGNVDMILVDTDMNGIHDTVLVDYDGVFEINGEEENPDSPVETPTETPAEPDNDIPVLQDEGVKVDLDGDGYEETEMFDTNGDGKYDLSFVDSDNDGYAESVYSDNDHDGIYDVVGHDYNGDGELDEVNQIDYSDDSGVKSVTGWGGKNCINNYTGDLIGKKDYIDSDNDGENDIYVHRYDSNGDGFLDTSEQFFDTDGDGEVDAVIKTVFIDTDGDGSYDTYTECIDEDADGTFDAVKVYDYDDFFGLGDLVHVYQDVGIDSNIFINESELYNAYNRPTFNPDSVDPENVVGNPEVSMDYWEFQGNTGRCAVYAQKFIIEQYTGQEIDIEDLVKTAKSNYWFDENQGTYVNNGNKLLDYYGVPNEVSYNNSLDDLRDALGAGKMVIVGVDADEYWGQDTDDIFSPSDGTNHAVQVIGIDDSDPENPMVILNDSGSPRGCGELVPADVFMDAWDDGNNRMIVAG